MKHFKTLLLVLVLAAIAGAISYLESKRAARNPAKGSIPITFRLENGGAGQGRAAEEIASPAGFINTDKITVGELIGKKVVLVDFWTYSCINCQRTTPYLNTWYEKYRDQGLEIIGMHTPEFEFEKKYDNVAAAVKKFGIKYPVVLDNNYATWNAYGNRYWPRKYLIDIGGRIAYDHIGEGAYEETERKIQDLLAERMAALGMAEKIPQGVLAPVNAPTTDLAQIKSPETYFGARRNANFGNGTPGVIGLLSLAPPPDTQSNRLYLVGQWYIQNEYAEARGDGAKIIFRYQAKDVYLVAGAEPAVKIRVLRDGAVLGAEAGSDVSRDGTAIIHENRLYKLIRGAGYGEHIIEILIENAGLQAFTFTFG